MLLWVVVVCLWSTVSSAVITVPVGDELALVLRTTAPGIVRSRIHQIRRTILDTTCEMVVHPPLSENVPWVDALSNYSLAEVKVVALDSEHLFAFHPKSGQYVVRLCDHVTSTSNPCPVYASGIDPNLTPSRSLFPAGPKRVLLYDAADGAYKMLFFDADVHGSGSVFHNLEGSIFDGYFSFKGPVEMFYFKASDSREFLGTFNPEDGSIVIHTYNSTARHPRELGLIAVSRGHVSLRHGATVKPFGSNDIIFYNQQTSVFEVVRLSMGSDTELVMTSVSHGNLTNGYACESFKSRRQCSSTPTCGWCVSDGKCRQVTRHILDGATQNCDGSVCKLPEPKALPQPQRVPAISRPQLDAPSIEPSISLMWREYLDSLANPEPAAVVQQAEETIISWESTPPSNANVEVEAPRIQRFYVPPQSIANGCMNGDVNCTIREEQVRAPGVVQADARQLEILAPQRRYNLQDSRINTTNNFFGNHPEDSTARGPSQLLVVPLPRNETEAVAVMEAGAKPCAKSRSEGKADLEMDRVRSSPLMREAMANSDRAPEHEFLEGVEPPIIVGGHTVSPSVTPTPTVSPSQTVSPTATASVSPSPSPSPTTRYYPCPERGVIVRDRLWCARCVAFVWDPNNSTAHLTRITITNDPFCAEDYQPQPQQLIQQDSVPSQVERNGPSIPEEVITLSRKAAPPPVLEPQLPHP